MPTPTVAQAAREIEGLIVECCQRQDTLENQGRVAESREEARYRQGLERALSVLTGEDTHRIRRRTFERARRA